MKEDTMPEVKMERIVMLVNKLLIIFCKTCFLFVLPIHFTLAQHLERSIQVSIHTGVSPIKPTVQKVYPGSPLYVNLKVSEPMQRSQRLSLSYITKKSNWRIAKGIDISSYSFVRTFDFDRSVSTATISREDHMFSYLSFKTIFFREILDKRIKISLGIGPSLDYLVQSKIEYDFIENGQHFKATEYRLKGENRYNLSVSTGVEMSYAISKDVSLILYPGFQYYFGELAPDDKRIMNFSIGVGSSISINK